MQLIKSTFTDKIFLKAALAIAVPVTLQSVLSTVTNMVDTMMIGTLGTTAISAVGLANKYFYVLSLLIYGVHSGTGLLIAQFYGSGDHLHIRKSFGLGLCINLFASFVFALLAGLCPEAVMRLFTDSAESTAIGCEYLRYVCFSYPLFAATSIMSSMLQSTRQVRVPVYASMVSILGNIFFNYCLIFGHFGFPCLGIQGAAIATVIARLLECLILIWFCFAKNEILRGKASDFFAWTGAFLNNYIHHSVPVILNEMTWGLGVTIYYVAYGRMGDEAVAAVTICETVTDIIAIFGNGLYASASVLLGNELGADRKDVAWDYSKKILVCGIATALFCMVLFLAIMDPVLSLFSVPESVLSDAKKCMQIFTCYLPLLFTYGIIIVGILRSGGDTKMCFAIDTLTVWLVGIPFAFLGALVWHLPVWAVYGLINTEQIVKTVFSLWRYSQKAWVRNITGNT